MRRAHRLAVRLLAPPLLAAGAAAQTTWHVPGDFPTLDIALHGPLAEGDTILVGPGTWPSGGLHTHHNHLVIRSTHGPEATILDGQFVGRIFDFHPGTLPATRIEGFTFYRGAGVGGAIAMSGAAEPTIVDCIFRSCRGTNGSQGGTGSTGSDSGTVGAQGGSGGTGGTGGAGTHGAAIRSEFGSPRIERCVFFDNVAGSGGKGGTGGTGGQGGPWGLFSDPGKGGTGGTGGIGGAAGQGGAIATLGGTPHLVNCVFRANRAGTGGAGGNGGNGGPGGNGPPLGSDGPTGQAGSGRNGAIGGSGGALYVGDPAAGFRIENCTFVDNLPGNGGSGGSVGFGGSGGSSGSTGAAGTGAAIRAHFGTNLELANSILYSNASATTDVILSSGSPLVTHCVTDFAPYVGVGNLQADPLLDLATPDPWDAPALLAASPCIDAADASELSAGSAVDCFGHPRQIADPLSPDGPSAGSPALDIGAAEYVPPATATLYACAFNPAGSLNLVSGLPEPGQTVAMTVHNPLGTQGLSFAFGVVSFGSFASAGNPCGIPVPGFGMSGIGALGGLAVDITPGVALPAQLLGIWTGSPVAWNLAFPAVPDFYGQTVTVQAAIAEASPGAVPLALTRAAALHIGS